MHCATFATVSDEIDRSTHLCRRIERREIEALFDLMEVTNVNNLSALAQVYLHLRGHFGGYQERAERLADERVGVAILDETTLSKLVCTGALIGVYAGLLR